MKKKKEYNDEFRRNLVKKMVSLFSDGFLFGEVVINGFVNKLHWHTLRAIPLACHSVSLRIFHLSTLSPQFKLVVSISFNSPAISLALHHLTPAVITNSSERIKTNACVFALLPA